MLHVQVNYAFSCFGSANRFASKHWAVGESVNGQSRGYSSKDYGSMLRVHVCQCGWDQVFVCMSSVSSCTDASLCVCMPTWLCTYIVVVYIQYVRLCVRDSALRARVCVCMYSGCLGAWRAGGALQGGLREASGEGSDAGVCQGGGREQLIPAADCGRQVQVLQEDLGHSHEALVVHTPIIPPHYYLEKKWQQFFFLLLSSAVETSQLLEDPKSIFHTTNLLTQ